MQQKLITLIGVGAVALLGASGAVAQPFGPGDGERGPRGFRGPGRFLELTEEQQAAARELREQRRPEMEALRDQLRENRTLLRESLESGSPDPTAVGELVIEGHALRQKGRALREESKEAFEGLLTSEQKRKLELLEAARIAGGPRGRRGMMGRRGGGWGPPGGGAPGDE
jgi:Spy/CpxP family protein refolding chaperone